MIENICIVDTETTGLSAKDCKLIEIAAIYYNLPTKSVLYEAASLFYAESNPVENINHIKPQMLMKVKEAISDKALQFIGNLMYSADFVIAHNAKFDKSFIEANSYLSGIAIHIKWICSVNDIRWKKVGSLKLKDIAAHCGVSYHHAHRAMNDCHILLKCLQTLPDLYEQLNKV